MQTQRFAHRMNPDGTKDSICYGCYTTVASVMDESGLAEPEAQHVCNPGRMLDLRRDVTGTISHRWRTDAA